MDSQESLYLESSPAETPFSAAVVVAEMEVVVLADGVEAAVLADGVVARVAAAEVVVAGAAYPDRPPDADPAPAIPAADSRGTEVDLVAEVSGGAAVVGVVVPAAKPIVLLQPSDS